MTVELSPNTQVILLLTAPLIGGQRSDASPDLLSPAEYKRLAIYLREKKRQPADLLHADDASRLLHDCSSDIDAERLRRLLGRGFLLSQVIEQWRARAIWVVSRADPDYPRRLKERLREDAPAVIYGCGDRALLDLGGLAVVGSRHVDAAVLEYAASVGQLVARAGRTLVSGGAKGVDQAAMRAALEAGGKACGILADSLERAAMNREHRAPLLAGRLVLISTHDPRAGFNVGNAMQRNKLIYALADAALVANSDLNRGGTWSGAVEQLDKLRFVPIYVRSTGAPSAGLDALLHKGARPWPNPRSIEELERIIEMPIPTISEPSPPDQDLFGQGAPGATTSTPAGTPDIRSTANTTGEKPFAEAEGVNARIAQSQQSNVQPAESLFDTVRASIRQLLVTPMKDNEVAAALGVLPAQAKAWLQRLVDEGMLEKRKRPAVYTLKQSGLFD
ncbi:MAG TPA: DNA-processing protein DprA [Methylococcus sp.]|nr:DNA-processing protein DprA [Methylococcus sp.]